jgi:hypothetical protein
MAIGTYKQERRQHYEWISQTDRTDAVKRVHSLSSAGIKSALFNLRLGIVRVI